MAVDAQLIEDAVRHLAAIDRPSASEGERVAAEWIAAALREEGCDARVEAERAHGTYWWPIGVPAALAGAVGLSGRRAPALIAGAFAAAAIADDISAGRQWFRRAFLPRRTTHNVIADAGDRDARDTVVLVAHHDAAHWSLLFHPAAGAWFAERFPAALEKADSTPPLMWPVFGAPLAVAVGALIGARRLQRGGAWLALATAATMTEIGSRSTVPGANDNLSGVATLLGVARALREQPVHGLRVVLLSTGAEESFMEGMQAYARRHFASLPTDRTHVICIDTVGSPELIQLDGEGMLRMRNYPEAFKDLVEDCAREAGVQLRRRLRLRNATDGLIALKAGYPTVMLGSINAHKLPDNYHWPTDTADRVTYSSIVDAVSVCEAVVRRLASRAAAKATASSRDATSPA